MHAIRATWKDGRIVPDGPVDWPDGCRLMIEPEIAETGCLGTLEEDWSNSPEAIADWLAWYDSLEPLEFTPEEARGIAAFEERMREFNVEAVRRQMREGANE